MSLLLLFSGAPAVAEVLPPASSGGGGSGRFVWFTKPPIVDDLTDEELTVILAALTLN